MGVVGGLSPCGGWEKSVWDVCGGGGKSVWDPVGVRGGL